MHVKSFSGKVSKHTLLAFALSANTSRDFGRENVQVVFSHITNFFILTMVSVMSGLGQSEDQGS